MGMPATYEGDEFEEYRYELPYGIKPRRIEYICLRCGRRVPKEEVDKRPAIMCPYCGYRILIKERAPANIVRPRRVYAI